MNRLKRIITLLAATAIIATLAAGVFAQEVIKKTTDDSGFEKQLTEIDLMHQTAAQYMSAGQWERASVELEKVVAASRDRLTGWQDLAKCYKEMKKYPEAAFAYKQATSLSPDNQDLLSNLGYMQLHAQDWDAATATYEAMLKVNESSYDANVHLAFIYQKNGDTESAIIYYEKALEGNANDIQTMGTLGKLYSDAGFSRRSAMPI